MPPASIVTQAPPGRPGQHRHASPADAAGQHRHASPAARL